MRPLADPRKIVQSSEPLVVLSNQTNSWVADLIDLRTNLAGFAPFDHAMLSIDTGEFVTQALTYSKVSMNKYLIPGGQLAFVQFVNSNSDFVAAFRQSVLNRLNGPTWSKWYDWLGIFGQAIGQPWIHTPGLRYCSVDVIRHMVNACPKLPKADQLVINNIPPETNPEALWKIIMTYPDTFSILGYWDANVGVTV